MIGRPAKAPPDEMLLTIKDTVSFLSSILESHLPQYFILGAMKAPRLAVVLVVDDSEDQLMLMQKIDGVFFSVLSQYESLDIWVLTPRDPLLATVKRIDCQI